MLIQLWGYSDRLRLRARANRASDKLLSFDFLDELKISDGLARKQAVKVIHSSAGDFIRLEFLNNFFQSMLSQQFIQLRVKGFPILNP